MLLHSLAGHIGLHNNLDHIMMTYTVYDMHAVCSAQLLTP